MKTNNRNKKRRKAPASSSSHSSKKKPRTSQNAAYEDLFDRMWDAAIMVDPELFTILDANFATERLLGLSLESLEGRSILDWINAEKQGEVEKALRITARRYYPRTVECEWVAAKGNHLTMELNLCGLKLCDGSHIIQVIAKDVTELRRTEHQLLQTTKMAALGEMAGGIAHEINNPLATISTYSEILKMTYESQPADRDTILKSIDTIYKTALRIAKIVKGLRYFSGVRDPRNSTEPAETANAIDMVNDAFAFCQEKFHSRGVEFKFDPPAEPLPIECRPVQVSQVLLNLMLNAADAIGDLPDKWVSVKLRDLGDSVEFRIIDSGPGIPAQVRDRLFEPFFTTKEVGKGTGLGLSIAKGLIEEHHGELSLDPKSQQTCFVVRLPKKSTIPQARGLSAA